MKKRLQHRCFLENMAKFSKIALFIEYLQWLLLNSIKKKLRHGCFPVKFTTFLRTSFLQSSSSGCFRGLTRVFKGHWDKTGANVSDKYLIQLKKVISNSTSVTNLPKGSNSWIFYLFKPFSILNFAMKKWFCRVTCFVRVFLFCFFFIFFFLKQFYNQVRCYHFLLAVLNCEFDTDVKIE